MTNREESARRIAANAENFREHGGDWEVHSESNPRRWYHVRATERSFGCACRDYRDNGAVKCKHILALELKLYKRFLPLPDPLPAEYLNEELGRDTFIQLYPHVHKSRRGWLLENEPDFGFMENLEEWEAEDVRKVRKYIALVVDQANKVESLIYLKTRAATPIEDVATKLGFRRVTPALLLYDPKKAPDAYEKIPNGKLWKAFVEKTEDDMEQLVASISGGTARFYAERTLRSFREKKRRLLDKLQET